MRDAIEDLDLQVMRMRCCHCGLNYDRSSKLPSDHICKWQLHARASRPTCGGARAKQQGNLPNSLSTQRNHTSAVHFSIHTRVHKGGRTYVQSPKNGPEWDHVVRR
eukprot:389920-Pyramimonas_sp.AAC.1